MRNAIIFVGWLLYNLVFVGLLAFSDRFDVRVVAWIAVSIGITLSGLVSVGGLFSKST